MTHATTTEQIAALEIFLEYLVIVIEAEASSFTLDKLNEAAPAATEEQPAPPPEEIGPTESSVGITLVPNSEGEGLLIIGALQWAVQWYRPQGALSLDQLTDQAMLLFTREK